jgi:hypothetical protein
MSHTFNWTNPSPMPYPDDPTRVIILHNGDYKGLAEVEIHYCVGPHQCAIDAQFGDLRACRMVRIPTQALTAFSMDSVRTTVYSDITLIRALEHGTLLQAAGETDYEALAWRVVDGNQWVVTGQDRVFTSHRLLTFASHWKLVGKVMPNQD